jgi:hypothetical protein
VNLLCPKDEGADPEKFGFSRQISTCDAYQSLHVVPSPDQAPITAVELRAVAEKVLNRELSAAEIRNADKVDLSMPSASEIQCSQVSVWVQLIVGRNITTEERARLGSFMNTLGRLVHSKVSAAFIEWVRQRALKSNVIKNAECWLSTQLGMPASAKAFHSEPEFEAFVTLFDECTESGAKTADYKEIRP